MADRTKLRCVQYRAGTSKGLFFRRQDLPASSDDWDPILLGAMGSPDPFGKQLDGVGGATSTTSKIAVVGKASEGDVADLLYTFVACPISGSTKLDLTGSCGNMLSAVGPFAIEEGIIVPAQRDGQYSVYIRNTNTNVVVRATFSLRNGLPVEDGDMLIDGVPTSGSPIRLDFLEPAGSMTGALLPTGAACDTLSLAPLTRQEPARRFQVSMVDAANPFVFVNAADLGLTGSEPVAALLPHTALLMRIRCAAAIAMGLAPSVEAAVLVPGTPKIALVGPPATFTTPSGRLIEANEADLAVRPFSMGAPHSSLQMTGAVCLAAACSVPGSIPYQLLAAARPPAVASIKQGGRTTLRFAHGSGLVVAESEVAVSPFKIGSTSVYRTARRLFEGNVCYIPHPPVKVVPVAAVKSIKTAVKPSVAVLAERPHQSALVF